MARKIPIQWLKLCNYCEMRFYLNLTNNFWAGYNEETPPTNNPNQNNKQTKKQKQEKPSIEITIEDALQRTRGTDEILIGRDVHLVGEQLAGRIDQIHIEDCRIIITKNNKCSVPYPPDRIKVFAYCVMFEKKFNPNRTLYAKLRNQKNNKVIYIERYSDIWRDKVKNQIQTI
ncbi:CRISPR-associated protein Cas4, RecB family nuclease [Methanonatronarchaeum thermophilum]|uniref:CRISPR-associated protein Cas4, RecB family nuclease n=1 Tax=Methanonatronarchaeum thermophilum TaxID=1927129 RepID=A0A1Y3GFK4_9EURY|nr:hypothetical protein [Methanonatronarchaeum thermophilum]OUJ18156.1 CRISPR-associated protein Cas4, RecB family nuclease [Methanonatronarchaeum thermophilum]